MKRWWSRLTWRLNQWFMEHVVCKLHGHTMNETATCERCCFTDWTQYRETWER